MELRRVGLRTELIIVFGLIAVLAVGINTIVVWGLARLLILDQRSQLVEASATLVALSAAEEINPQKAVDAALADPNIVGAAVFNRHGERLASGGDLLQWSEVDANLMAALYQDENTVTDVWVAGSSVAVAASVPFHRLGTAVPPAGESGAGALRVVMRLKGNDASTRRFRTLSFIYVGMNALVIAVFGLWLISRSVIRPVRALSDASTTVALGDFSRRVPVRGSGEVAELARAFNRMSEALEERELRIANQLLDLKRSNERLQHTQSQLVESEKLAGIGRLAAGIAHEMGNPLGAITGYVSLVLGSDALSDEDRKALEGLAREAGRLDRIIRELLDYARPSENRAEPVDVHSVVSDAVSMMSSQPTFKRVDIAVTAEEDLPQVEVDPHRLQQVLVNLLANAGDALGGEGKVEVLLRAGASGDVEIAVTDSGPGLDDEALEELFEPFFTTKERGEGTGLGLAICRRIVTEAGGRITASNAPQGGARFLVRLPARDKLREQSS